MKSVFQYLLFWLLLAVLFLPEFYWPTVERWTGWSVLELGGAEQVVNAPSFSWKQWLNGRYQQQFDAHQRQSNALRPLAVRLRNQAEYEIFGDLGNRNHYLGADQFIFDHSYTDAYLGKDYSGHELIEEKVRKIKVIQDYCLARGLKFMVATPPGKPNLFPEKMPPQMRKTTRRTTNRASYIAAYQKQGISFVDFSHFKAIQDTSAISLYPQAGLHWNFYGVGLAMDTLRNFMANQFDLPLGQIHWRDQISFSKDFASTDIEMMNGINLLHPFELEAQPYPDFRFDAVVANERPRILVVGDSYFNILWEQGFVQGLFHPKSSFWYYFNQDYSSSKSNLSQLKKRPDALLEQLQTYDVILLTMSESNLKDCCFQFVDHFYQAIENQKRK